MLLDNYVIIALLDCLSTALFRAKVTIDGSSDAIQLTVQGHSTQTANLQEWQNSASTVVASISNVGRLIVKGGARIEGDTIEATSDVYARHGAANMVGFGMQGGALFDKPGVSFGSDQDTNLYRDAANTLKTDDSLVVVGTLTLSATNIITDTTTGMKIGTATTQKLGFFNTTPVVQPSGNIITALGNLGLIATPTIALTDVATLSAGTYTPTRSAEANLDANVTMTQAQYSRTGNSVTVSGRFTADPTLTATATSFEITLPVASNIGAVEDAAGVAFCGGVAGMGGEVIGVVANDTAKIQWTSTDTTSKVWSYTYSYRII